MSDQPATTQEIFEHLQQLTNETVVARVKEVAALIQQGYVEEALEHLYEIDGIIGGFGLHTIRHVVSLADFPGHSVEDREIHRPIQYVRMILRSQDASELTRFLIDSACGLVEVHLKRMVKFGFVDNFFNARKPMGWLLDKKFKNKLPQSLFEDLLWLNNGIYIFSKHDFDLRSDKQAEEPYFGLGEAIAIYLVARKLIVDLEALHTNPKTVSQ